MIRRTMLLAGATLALSLAPAGANAACLRGAAGCGVGFHGAGAGARGVGVAHHHVDAPGVGLHGRPTNRNGGLNRIGPRR